MAKELDENSDGVIDTKYGGTGNQNGFSLGVESAKSSGIAGSLLLFTAQTTSVQGTGFLGPDTASGNVYFKLPSGTPTEDYVLTIGSATTETIDGVSSTVIPLIPVNPTSFAGVGGYVEPPTYSDSSGTEGQYSWDASYFYVCTAANTWDRFPVTLANWDNPMPTAPTVTSITVGTNGTTVTIVFDKNVSIGAGGSGGLTLNTPTSALTYSSGAGTSTLVFTSATTILQTDTPTCSYTQPGNGFEATTGTVDLASFSGTAVTNNSTQGSSSVETLRPTSDITTGSWSNTGEGYWQAVSDQSDSSYMSTTNWQQSSLLGLANTSASSGKTISNVTIKARIRNTNGSAVPEIQFYRNDINRNAISAVTGSFAEYSWSMNVNPETSGAWTSAMVDAMSVGVRSANTTNNTAYSEIWVEVTYTP